LKHIVFTVTNDITFDRRMQRICETLSENNFEVSIVGRQQQKSLPLDNKPYKQIRLQCFFNKGKLFYIEYNIRLFWFLLFYQADIFCAIDLDTIVPVFWVSSFKGKKRVFDAHEYFEEVPEVVNRKGVQWIWSMVAQMYIPKFHVCYTVSQSLADEFQNKYHTHFEVIRNVPPLVNERNISERKYLLYQGALNEGRGLEALIAAMPQINMPLKIAGEGDLSKQLRALVEQNNLENKIEFLGFVKPEQLPELTKHAFVGLNLLENKGKSYYYSLANKFFDYIQYETPVITMDFPEYRNINAQFETCILLNELSPEAIIKSVEKLKSDNTLYLKLKENCSHAKHEFNWQKESMKLITVYQNLQ
jgi:glycosyltransferase involved in cell wall biosynthesis